MLSNEIFANDNGLKDRVTACRKRLRLNRIHRANGDNQPGEVFQEIVVEASEFGDSSGNRAEAMRQSLKEGIPPSKGDTGQRVEGQEVGIT